MTGLLVAAACGASGQVPATKSAPAADTVRLPAPRARGPLSLEEALAARRSVRQWAPGSLKLEEAAQLVWAAQGVTSPDGKRTAPSAMGRYPIQVYVVAAGVDGLAPGVYRYVPATHALARLVPEDRRPALAAAARGQASVATAPLTLVLTADPAKFGARTDERTDRFMAIEAGAVLQNIQLQAASLKLGSVPVGGYQDAPLAQALPLSAGERPMIVVPIGRKP
jgi:SagB-type dehydrogenase family enzyme